jgi:hypothetical protein
MRPADVCQTWSWIIELDLLLQLFEYFDEKRRLAFLQKKHDPCLGKLQFPETLLDSAPEPVPLFSFRQVEIRRQLGEPLVGDRIQVLVVPLDDLPLVWRVVGHSTALLAP